jgi:hypothetical protein
MWRTLQLRNFVNQEHQLTPWGKVLHAAFSALHPDDNLEEACFLAIELLRSKVLKADITCIHTYSGKGVLRAPISTKLELPDTY